MTRARIGILLFLLWWLPAYLLVPAIAELLGMGGDAQARREITIWVVGIQTVIGLLGLFLAGKELFAALRTVRRRRVLRVAWRIVWSGDTDIADDDRRAGPPATGSSPSDEAPHGTAGAR